VALVFVGSQAHAVDKAEGASQAQRWPVAHCCPFCRNIKAEGQSIMAVYMLMAAPSGRPRRSPPSQPTAGASAGCATGCPATIGNTTLNCVPAPGLESTSTVAPRLAAIP
jgi:hypothetical protein